MLAQREGEPQAAKEKARVMIVDGHTIMREGLKELLERSGDFEVVGEAGDGAAAVEASEKLAAGCGDHGNHGPGEGRGGGLPRDTGAFARLPGAGADRFATDEDSVLQAAAAGATGYLQKSCSREKLLETLRDVADGEFRLPATALKRVFANVHITSHRAEAAELASLTARERETVTLYANGMTYAEIAEVMGIRPLTVRNSIYAIQNKLKVKSKQELVVRAVRGGLLDP